MSQYTYCTEQKRLHSASILLGTNTSEGTISTKSNTEIKSTQSNVTLGKTVVQGNLTSVSDPGSAAVQLWDTHTSNLTHFSMCKTKKAGTMTEGGCREGCVK